MKSDKIMYNKTVMKEHKIDYKWEIVWRNVFIFIYIHVASLYGIYIMFFRAKLWTIVWQTIICVFASIGITGGAHRLWCHQSYKARWPLRLFLMIFNCVAFQDTIYDWSRDHRTHHKFCDSDGDPYNARRGFFFSHVGWLMIRKHPDVIKKGATIDMSDLDRDFILVFQKKWYLYLMPICCFIVPTFVPWWIWGENLTNAWYLTILKYCLQLNITWSINSVAHKWGVKPYNKLITAVDSRFVFPFKSGENWHNYHHVFPWDYKSAELGIYSENYTLAFINFCAYLGLAYNLKSAPPDMVKKRILKNNQLLTMEF